MIHICIYSYGKDPYLHSCLDSLKKSSYTDFVIDLYIYGDKPDLDEYRKNFGNRLTITPLTQDKNFSEITNISIQKSFSLETKYFMLLNSDTILEKNCIKYLINFLNTHNHTYGIIGGLQTEYNTADWNTWNSWSNDNLKSPIDTEYYTQNNLKDRVYQTYYAQGACMIFPLSLVRKIGMFEERFGFFYEETEFCRRTRMYGLKVGIIDSAKVQHLGGGSWQASILKNFKRDIYYLSNQITYESTDDIKRKSDSILKIMIIIKKQIRNIILKNDRVKLPLILYPFVIFRFISNLSLFIKLRSLSLKNKSYGK